MDYLREGIHLRGFAQIEPIVAYKNEAYTLFADLMNTIWADFTRMVFNLEFEAAEGEEPEQRYETSGSPTRPGRVSYSGGSGAPSALAMAAAGGGVAEEELYEDAELPPPVEQRVLSEEQTLGRNDPCWCGSGKKFKKCHGA
jgi:preprotein translocase subunit SecA